MKTILSIIFIELLCLKPTLAMEKAAVENEDLSVSPQNFIASVENLNWAIIQFLASYRPDRYALNNEHLANIALMMKESLALRARLSLREIEEVDIWYQALEGTIKLLGSKFPVHLSVINFEH